ncbi:hypothetical protein L207DRAFT_82559 [Hyaloscypha variabilis F]|jgi:hypothetical protein|uniref:Uncharacterized protein n=1 Tax=Hyaloscypha variabilis (strain UAMH 11265 / GT02V1 / F) TaxID=1149755 RepID=A0A2J6RD91_HYAVF|nr:hypothetical protein L207DRAFT_82559 [Hyaloscypha variabilis F]
MSDHKKTSPKAPTPLHIPSERSPPPAPYRRTIDRGSPNDTDNSSNKNEAASTALPFNSAVQQKQPGNRVDPMRRSYPAPTEPLDIAKALELTPRPHTFRHQLREIKKAAENMAPRVMSKEDEKAEFERVKSVLKSWGKNE